MFRLKTILQPTDFSEHARYALELACALARDQDARVILLHVVPGPAVVTCGGEELARRRAEQFEEDFKNYREEMKEKLQQLCAAAPSVRVEPLLQEGDVATTIARIAEQTPCDLIVMGTHGRTGEARHLLGSVAETVTCKAPCPVLTVRLPTAPYAAAPVPEHAGVSR